MSHYLIVHKWWLHTGYGTCNYLYSSTRWTRFNGKEWSSNRNSFNRPITHSIWILALAIHFPTVTFDGVNCLLLLPKGGILTVTLYSMGGHCHIPNCTSFIFPCIKKSVSIYEVKNTRITTLLTKTKENTQKTPRCTRKYDPWTTNNPLRERCKQILQPYQEKGLLIPTFANVRLSTKGSNIKLKHCTACIIIEDRLQYKYWHKKKLENEIKILSVELKLSLSSFI